MLAEWNQPLNAADRLMLVGHQGLRGIGHGGFQTQTHLWLDGRLDKAALRTALERFNHRYPVVTSRLDESNPKAPAWRYRAGAVVELQERELTTADPKELWNECARLFERPMDHDRDDPVTFHLFHLPDGGDVLVMRFAHVLMDGKGPEFALQELNRLFDGGDADAPPANPSLAADEMAAQLAKFPRKRRIRAALNVVRSHIQWPSKTATMNHPDMGEWVGAPYGIRVRRLDEKQTEALAQNVKKLCGFGNLSLAVVASTFRTISRMSPCTQKPSTRFQLDLPLNLRPPGRAEPIFRNFMSFIQMSATKRELGDRDELIRRLNTVMRDQIRRGIDLGNLQMMAIMSQHTGLLKRHIMDRMKNHPFTLGFGFLGPVLPGLEQFGGRRTNWVYSLNTALSPPGITLEANQFRGQLNLMLTYIAATVPDQTAEAFLENLVEDMLA